MINLVATTPIQNIDRIQICHTNSIRIRRIGATILQNVRGKRNGSINVNYISESHDKLLNRNRQ